MLEALKAVVPGIEELVVYGFPIYAVVQAVLGIVAYFTPVSDKAAQVASAFGVVVGYLLSMNLPALESWVPSIAVWLPQLFAVIIILALMLGVTPGKIVEFGQRVRARAIKDG